MAGSISGSSSAMAQGDANAQFVALANEYIAEFLELEPEFATYQGEHRYDDRLSDVSRAGFTAKLAFHKSYLGRLEGDQRRRAVGANRIDYRILQSRMEGQIWSLTELREHEWNPMTYNPGNAIYLLLEREFAAAEASPIGTRGSKQFRGCSKRRSRICAPRRRSTPRRRSARRRV